MVKAHTLPVSWSSLPAIVRHQTKSVLPLAIFQAAGVTWTLFLLSIPATTRDLGLSAAGIAVASFLTYGVMCIIFDIYAFGRTPVIYDRVLGALSFCMNFKKQSRQSAALCTLASIQAGSLLVIAMAFLGGMGIGVISLLFAIACCALAKATSTFQMPVSRVYSQMSHTDWRLALGFTTLSALAIPIAVAIF